jgi:hypothetical protein
MDQQLEQAQAYVDAKNYEAAFNILKSIGKLFDNFNLKFHSVYLTNLNF